MNDTKNTAAATPIRNPDRDGYNRNEKMARIAELITNNNIEFSGEYTRLGDELIVWECSSDWGEAGWMLGEFCYYELGPWLPTLHTKVFFKTKAAAMAAMEDRRAGSECGGDYSPLNPRRTA